jgi:hypothetical protein
MGLVWCGYASDNDTFSSLVGMKRGRVIDRQLSGGEDLWPVSLDQRMACDTIAVKLICGGSLPDPLLS